MSDRKARAAAESDAAIDMERAVLASVMFDPRTLAVVSDTVIPDDFSDIRHRQIYLAILRSGILDEVIDPVGLRVIDPLIDPVLLTEIFIDPLRSTGNAQRYAKSVAKAARRRRRKVLINDLAIADLRNDDELVDRLTAEIGLLRILENETGDQDLSGVVWERFSDIQEESIEWLWQDWIAKGKLHLLAGVQGDGKSTLLTDIGARQSRGATLPDGSRPPAKRIGFLISEDGVSDTVLPRLRLHGANLHNIFYLKSVKTEDGERPLNLADDRERIRQFIVQHQLDEIFVDALSDFMGRAKRNDEGEVRGVLTPLGQMANETGCAIVGIVHLGKPGASARRAVERVLGSGAFTQVARIVWAVSTDPEDESRRYLGQVKNNLAPEVPTLAWHRERDQPIAWDGDAGVSVKALMSGMHEKATKVDSARDFLERFLKGGGKPAKDVFDQAKADGIGRDAVYKASDELGVTKAKESGKVNGQTYWRLPDGLPVASDIGAVSSVSSERLVSSVSSVSTLPLPRTLLPDLPDLPDVSTPPEITDDDLTKRVLAFNDRARARLSNAADSDNQIIGHSDDREVPE